MQFIYLIFCWTFNDVTLKLLHALQSNCEGKSIQSQVVLKHGALTFYVSQQHVMLYQIFDISDI